MKGCASDPPNATQSFLIKPGLRPGPWELYGARCQASEVVSHAPTAMALTISEGGCTRHSGHALSPSLPTAIVAKVFPVARCLRSEEHTSELQSLMRISYAVFCLKKKTNQQSDSTNI